MNRTSPCCRSVSSAARSPARTRAGPGGDAQPDAHLRRHDAGQRRLAQTRGPGEQQVVDGLFAPPRRLEHDLEVLGELRLPVELVEAPGPETGLVGELGRVGQGVHRPRRGAVDRARAPTRDTSLDLRRVVSRRQHLAPAVHRAPASSRNAWREQLLDRALVSPALEGPPDLLGAVAELGQGGTDLAPRLGGRPLSTGHAVPGELGKLEARSQVEDEPGRRLAADAGDDAQRARGPRRARPGPGRPVAARSSTARARAGPTPCAPSKASKHRRSSVVANP